MKNKLIASLIGICLSAASVIASEKIPESYTRWLNVLKEEMLNRGISQKTIDEAFAKNYYHPKHAVVKKDRNQTEFVLKNSAYLHRVVAPIRVKQGHEKYVALMQKYPEGVLGVPLHYLVAFWGIETNFGMNKGGFSAIESLTILSYDKRRPKFFREELYNALKIIDAGHISVSEMEGSWAGAMGHFQFMPSTFQSYALDADGNGKIDIWHNFDDALLSAANYLSSIGWKTDEPWGMPVELPWKFDYSQTGRNDTKTIKEWKKLGVQIKGLKDDVEGAIIVPEGYRGKAYLILDNFHIIMKWNRSENYALAVGLLADKIKNNQTAEIKINTNLYPLTKQEILKIQKFINQRKIIKIDEDGALGAHTKKAVQKLQQKFKLPADGYPDYRLLKDIDNFSKNGYYPPLPSQKLHRGK